VTVGWKQGTALEREEGRVMRVDSWEYVTEESNSSKFYLKIPFLSHSKYTKMYRSMLLRNLF
jgi:hypothetical protein